jgi:hypothetical protein
LAAITQAGGWKSTRMPLQYAEKINAGRSAMARAAAVAGREEAKGEPHMQRTVRSRNARVGEGLGACDSQDRPGPEAAAVAMRLSCLLSDHLGYYVSNPIGALRI